MTIAKMYRLQNASLKTLPESAGPAAVVGASFGEDAREVELWGSPGVWTMPPDDTHGAFIPMGGNRFGAVVATHHYKTPRPTLAKGEAAIGSTNADGTTLMARATFYADGKISVSNATKDLLTILNSFVDAVAAGVTVSGGPFNPASIAAINAVKVQLALLLKVPV